MVLIHGILEVTVLRAEGLLNLDSPAQSGALKCIFEGITGGRSKSDPYVTVHLGSEGRIAKTRTIENDCSPVWNEKFCVPVCHTCDDIIFRLKDADNFGSSKLGIVRVFAEELLREGTVEGRRPVLKEDGSGSDSRGHLNFKLLLRPHGSAQYSFEVPNTYVWRSHTGCRVKLYQDAHQNGNNFIPEVELGDGSVYEVRSCWEDIQEGIQAATRFIYVCGWAVNPARRLLRAPGAPTVGELLKAKAESGVCVLVMVWDDASSSSILNMKTGVMGTHDERTHQYFKGTPVKVKKAPRVGGKWDKLFKAVYTHHQKCVICDTPASDGSGGLKVMAFLGGIDLTDGRYDTAEHTLFSTLEGIHAEDFYQPVQGISPKHGPREPWEDIHCCVVGRPALDVKQNFEERWEKLVHGTKHLFNGGRSLPPEFCSPEDMGDVSTDDPKSWNAQIFRSIDARSVEFDPEARAHSLWIKKGRAIERSIQDAYIHHIRRSKRFLYIENQYFVGSCFSWAEDQDAGAVHLVPVEIAAHICEKIRAGEEYAAYIVIPMFPEGDPESESVQAILHFQKNTMESMYRMIADAIRETGTDAHPTDFLCFFCLGQREPEGAAGGLPDGVSPDSLQGRLLRSRRFMIYVHSKMMVVDDEYVIVGSANINMRSMAGARDSEIAMGAYQPAHVCDGEGPLPRGDVHGFRMSLWAEHIGTDGAFLAPHSRECVRRVREVARQNWEAYSADEPTAMQSHLMAYPVDISRDGGVRLLPGQECFPDFPDAPVTGRKSSRLPFVLTT